VPRSCKRVSSERFKLLYDIYHIADHEGDVIRTIRDKPQVHRHYTTPECPADTRSMQRRSSTTRRSCAQSARPILRHVAQEFIPTRDARTALAEAIQICSV
jgi:hydroxypyruvate isomerase